MDFYKLNKKCISNIFIYILIISILGLIYYNLFSKTRQIEGLEQNPSAKLKNMGVNTSISTDNAHNFCVINQSTGSKLNDSCRKLTRFNCQRTECCILKGAGHCVAGDKKNGPMFPNH